MSLPQPVPPSWKDLGKSSSDLLSKDYPFHGTALEVKTKTPSNVTFKVAGTRNAHGAITGDIESKMTNKQHGLTLTNTWNTVNVLKTQVELDNQITQGLKLDLVTTIAPSKGMSKSAVLNAVYKQSGAKAVYDPKLTNGGVSIEVGTKTYLDSAAFVKAKINNAGILALGYTQSLRPGVKASFGLAVDTQKLNEVDPSGPVHKIGMSFVFES